jgi:predicted AlkP superfamily phosphohydrolase/phosphomutase
MRYLRLFTNAVLCGVLGAAYLAVLVLQLNPQVPAGSITAVRWFGTLLMFYGLYLSAAIYLLLLIRELLAARPLSPAWLSVRLLAWVGAAEAALAALITWRNLQGFRAMLSSVAAERLRDGAIATTAFAAILLVLAILRYSFGRRGTRPAAVLLALSMMMSVLLPLWLRGSGFAPVPAPRGPSHPPRPSASSSALALPHVRLLLLDGASMRFIRQRVAAGQLPNFANVLDRGAAIDLATLKPTQAETVWAAAATGKYPPKNGVRSRIRRVGPDDVSPVDLLPDYCFAQALVVQNFVTEEDFTSSDALQARTMWDILADYGVPSGVINWPLTYPAHAENGYVISDQFDEGESYPLRLAEAGAPTTAAAIARESFDLWRAVPWQDVMSPTSVEEAEPPGLQRARWDRAYHDASIELDWQFRPRLTAIRYEALDVFGHSGLRQAEPELFGQIGRSDPHRSLLDRSYASLDVEIGRLVEGLAPGDLLLVVSSFGMDQETLLKQLVARARGESARPGTHDRAPDGFLIAYGTNVAPNPALPRGAIVDLAPTVLYYLGLPIGRDMDGFARADLFRRSYTVEHPVTYIASHER